MGTPSNFQTPMRSQPGSSDWQRQMPEQNNQFIIPRDPHVIGTLDGSTRPYPSWNDVDWVFLPIHVAGNHWATGVIHLANSHFYRRRTVRWCKNDTINVDNWQTSDKVAKKRMKSATWVVNGVNAYQYEGSDGQYIREVNLQTGICGCRKWQLSGLSCSHVIAITRFLGLTDCFHYAADWFKKPKYQATYSESIHSLGNMHQWEFPENIQKAIPPRMDNPQPGRPKNTNRIQSQGEEPRIIHCTRCTQTGHRRDQCGQPFVVQPPVNICTHNDQQFT
nr:transposase, MuDR, MULE transposase domain protein [Tanacetum cinerariifolium]